MSALTDAGSRAIADLSARYGLSQSAVEAMARAVANGGGTMAQFNIPELGGSGQWMAGGMTMVGDMFNSGLQATVAGLCTDLSNAMARELFFVQPSFSPGNVGQTTWWPSDLGQPSASGGQNQMRYAYFPGPRRLAIDPGDGGPVRLLDTGDHQIGGFSQQQSGPGDPFFGLTFSSQFGQFAVASLPTAGGSEPAPQSSPPPPPEPSAPPPPLQQPSREPPPSGPQPDQQQAPAASDRDVAETLALIAKLAELRDAGALSEEEFVEKKRELLARI
ncbi:MAG: SHOCT domain-containing protein [Pseudomonadota bacterium]